jgi:hypothetical protein
MKCNLGTISLLYAFDLKCQGARLGTFLAGYFHYSTPFLKGNARPVPGIGPQKPPALAYTGFNPDTVPPQCVVESGCKWK